MESVAACLAKRSCAKLTSRTSSPPIPAVRAKTGDRAVLRAIHFYNECRRAVALREAVERDEFDAFLRLIIAGGHSSFEYNQNAYSIHAPQQQGVPLALAISQSVLEGRGAWRQGRRLCGHHPGVRAA